MLHRYSKNNHQDKGMESFRDLSVHRSIPVETDESMTASSLDLVWPASHNCKCHKALEAGKSSGATPEMCVSDVDKNKYLDCYDHLSGELRVCPSRQIFSCDAPLLECPTGMETVYMSECAGNQIEDLREDFSVINLQHSSNSSFPYSYIQNLKTEDEESLEKPSSLRSELGENFPKHALPLKQKFYGEYQTGRDLCGWDKQPVFYPQPGYPVYKQQPSNTGHLDAKRGSAVVRSESTGSQSTTPVRQLMSEVCVQPSPATAAAGPAPELRRSISLPDSCRDVFITYSVDTAAEMLPFVSFLLNHGFRPAIDIFEDKVRQMDANKWMDGFLKNKSVLIIVAISPKYKIDVEGDGSDQHGLHTKYIYSQMQNEFIQQRCLNFRIVPVLFANAKQSHVPLWLQSTRLYRWPEDTNDLLLRLLREEKYIFPPLGKELTLTIKPV